MMFEWKSHDDVSNMMAPPAPPLPSEGQDNLKLPVKSETNTNMVNGTGDSSSSGTPIWEKPWSTDDIRKQSNSWTLAGDAGLLNQLQMMSQNMLAQTHQIQQEVDGLMNETKAANSRISNAINDFLMLSNTQFVENRVYDEEIQDETPTEEKKQDEQEKTKEQWEAELIPRICKALSLGLDVVDSAFEQVELQDSESEDEEESPYKTLPVLEPKDPYIHRPLPYIIGSENFMKDDFVGLGESPSEDEFEDSEKESVSISEKSDDEHLDGDNSDSESVSETEHISAKLKPKQKSKLIQEPEESDGSLDGDLFGPNSQKEFDDVDEEDSPLKTSSKKPVGPSSFAAELASKLSASARTADSDSAGSRSDQDWEDNMDTSKLKSEQKIKRTGSTSSTTSKKSTKSLVEKSQRTSSKLSKVSENKTSEPNDKLAEEENEDDSIFTRKSGLFSGGGGLFDDLDEEDNLFNDKTADTKKEAKKRTTSIKQSSKSRESSSFLSENSEVISQGISKSLFDDDDDDGDLFSTSKNATPHKKKEKKKQDKIFTDEEDENDIFSHSSKKKEVDLFSQNKKIEEDRQSLNQTPKKKLPAGAVSMFGGVDPFAVVAKSQQPASDNEKEAENNDWSDSDKAMSERRSSKSSNSLHSTGGGSINAESKKGSRSNSCSSTSASLFAEEPEADDLFSSNTSKSSKPKPKPIGGVSLFDDDNTNEDDDLFSKKKSVPEIKESSKLLAKSLFEDNDSDLFSTVTKTSESKKPNQVPGLFGDEDQMKVQSNKKSEAPLPKKNQIKKVSLFDEDDDTEDLFADLDLKKNETLQPEPKPEVKPRSKSVFEDEDVLFGGPQQEAPTVDLFGSKSSSKTNNVSKSTKPKESSKPAAPTSKKSGLFGAQEDDDEDLFSTSKKPEAKPVGKPPIPTPRKPSLPKEETPRATAKLDKPSTLEQSSSEEQNSSGTSSLTGTPKKKPIGGVSLFGGIDPFAKLKDDNTAKAASDGVTSDLKVESDNSQSPKVNLSPLKSDSSAPKLETFQDTKETNDVSVSFDDPAKANTLHNAGKDRVKIQARRRPPTRKGRQEALRHSGIFGEEESAKEAVTQSVTQEQMSGSSVSSTPLSPDERKLFLQTSEITVASSETDGTSKISKQYLSIEEHYKTTTAITSPSTEEEDIFCIGSPLPVHNIPTEKPKTRHQKDLFSDHDLFPKDDIDIFGSEDSDSLFISDKKEKSNITVEESKTTVEIKNTEEIKDELFASSKKKETKQIHISDDIFVSASSSNPKSPDIFDDIFASSPSIKTLSKKSTTNKSLFDEDDEDIDIFADMSTTRKSPTKPSPSISQTSSKKFSSISTKKSLFDDDDDDSLDIFEDPLAVKK